MNSIFNSHLATKEQPFTQSGGRIISKVCYLVNGNKIKICFLARSPCKETHGADASVVFNQGLLLSVPASYKPSYARYHPVKRPHIVNGVGYRCKYPVRQDCHWYNQDDHKHVLLALIEYLREVSRKNELSH
eukprot:XP_001706295.1 Hypothetical protein GL50803_20416 [Giardia lamblia ATCC 50803]